MSERPILFSAPMIRAILDGSKTQTRRNIKPQPHGGVRWTSIVMNGYAGWVDGHGAPVRCPYGNAGDHLWVREAWRACAEFDAQPPRDIAMSWPTRCEADGTWIGGDPCGQLAGKLRNSMFMPRWASRITLEVTDVHVERLQDISAQDILAEGSVLRAHDDQFGHNPVSRFDDKLYMDLKSLWAAGWEKINGAGSWALNPLVWCVSFRQMNHAL